MLCNNYTAAYRLVKGTKEESSGGRGPDSTLFLRFSAFIYLSL